MANALDAVLNLVAQDRAQQQQNVDNFTTGINSFNQQVQNARQNQLQQLQIRAGLAQSALQLNQDGSISYNQNYVNPNTQFQALLAGQSAAKTAQNPAAYQMYSGVLNRLMGAGGQSASPAGVAQQAVIGSGPTLSSFLPSSAPNAAPASTVQTANGNVTTGGSMSTDPVSGLTTGTSNVTNIPGTQAQSLAANQATAVGLANTEAAQAQSVLDEKRNNLSQMIALRRELSNGRAVGNSGIINGFGSSEANYAAAGTPLGIGAIRENPTMAGKAATLKELAKKGDLSDVQPETATFGAAGAKRIGGIINTSTGDLGNLNLTNEQFTGTARAQLINAAQKTIGLQRYANSLKNPQDMSALKNSQILAGISSEIGKITPQEQAQIDKMVNSTLGIKFDPVKFAQQAKAKNYSDAEIQKYIKDSQ